MVFSLDRVMALSVCFRSTNSKKQFYSKCFRCVYRSLSEERKETHPHWYRVYHERKKRTKDLKSIEDSKHSPHDVFVNNEICLSDIKVYGFDYDYTLASYNQELQHVLYDLGKQALIKKYNYPDGISKQQFDPEFAIRGLHYDIRKGLLMKIDSFHNIQLGSVYRGTTPIGDEEVLSLYEGTHVGIEDMNTFYGTAYGMTENSALQGPMHQLVDIFAIPELNLITNVTDFFIENNIPYDPEYVFYDIRNAVQEVHTSGLLHQTIMDDLEKFLDKGEETKQFLKRLAEAGKRMFIITNSGFPFIDAGMNYLVGEHWRDMFDIIVVHARKPKFFNENSRPFRVYNPKNEAQSWGRVKTLEKGKIYIQGNFRDFRHMTGWYGSKVLYFGDHVYSDLADPALKHGWRTAAIIPELESEIETMMDPNYKADLRWLIALQCLVEEIQETGCKDLIDDLLAEREELRQQLKAMCNKRFGSMFRTHHNPTYFSRRLARFADMYMSRPTNLLKFSVDHTFYPRRMALPHEPLPFGDYTQSKV